VGTLSTGYFVGKGVFCPRRGFDLLNRRRGAGVEMGSERLRLQGDQIAMDRTIAALFANGGTADAARDALLDHGLAPARVRVVSLESPPRGPGAALAEGFARALAGLGLGTRPAGAHGAERILVVTPAGDTDDVLAILEACGPLAVDRAAERWADAPRAARETVAGLTGWTSGAATGTDATSLNNAASGLTPGRAAAPGPTIGVGPSVGMSTGLGTADAPAPALPAITPDDGLGSSDPRRDAEIAAERNRLARN
jgi:hypothetical protein